MSLTAVVGFGIADLKDAFLGERVWLVGNGPSAESWSMDEMRGLGGYVFGMNRCWRPSPRTGEGFDHTDFHCFVAGHHFDDLMAGRVNTGTAFVPLCFAQLMIPKSRWPADRRKNKCPLVAIRLTRRHNSSHSGRPFGFNYDNGSVVSTFAGHLALTLAVYLGFAEILLVGYDLNNGEGHFFDKPGSATSPKGFNRENMVKWFDQAAVWLSEGENPEEVRTFGAMWGTRTRPLIVNCNPGSAIRVFPFASKKEIRDGALETHARR